MPLEVYKMTPEKVTLGTSFRTTNFKGFYIYIYIYTVHIIHIPHIQPERRSCGHFSGADTMAPVRSEVCKKTLQCFTSHDWEWFLLRALFHQH